MRSIAFLALYYFGGIVRYFRASDTKNIASQGVSSGVKQIGVIELFAQNFSLKFSIAPPNLRHSVLCIDSVCNLLAQTA